MLSDRTYSTHSQYRPENLTERRSHAKNAKALRTQKHAISISLQLTQKKPRFFSFILYQFFSLSDTEGCNLSTSRFSLTVNKHHLLQNVSMQTHSNWHHAFIRSFFINFPVVLKSIPACNGRKTLYRSITQTYPVLHPQSQVTANLT